MYFTDSLDSVVDNDEFGDADSSEEKDEEEESTEVPSIQLLPIIWVRACSFCLLL